MSISTPSHLEEFKIAIICALPLEAKTVQLLFDNLYDDPLDADYREVLCDPNAYTLGSIGNTMLSWCICQDQAKALRPVWQAILK